MYSTQPKRFVNSTEKEKISQKNGLRKCIFSVRPNPEYYEEKKLGETKKFPFTSGSRYTGNWKENKKDGFGTLIYVNGNKYEGEWKNDKRHGKGTYWVKEGKKLFKEYAGDWVNDKRSGMGRSFFKDGSKYEGEWENSCRDGKGVMVYPDGNVYEGGWAADQKSGLGVINYSNGDKFEGHFLNDKKDGPGRYFYPTTGKVYEGEWVNDIPKCGELKEMDDRVKSTFQEISEPFDIPQLGLENPEQILADTVTKIRQDRAARLVVDNKQDNNGEREDLKKLFDERELNFMREMFDQVGDQDDGLMLCGSVGSLLSNVGLAVDEYWLQEFMTHLEAGPNTKISFPEFVDIVAIITSEA